MPTCGCRERIYCSLLLASFSPTCLAYNVHTGLGINSSNKDAFALYFLLFPLRSFGFKLQMLFHLSYYFLKLEIFFLLLVISLFKWSVFFLIQSAFFFRKHDNMTWCIFKAILKMLFKQTIKTKFPPKYYLNNNKVSEFLISIPQTSQIVAEHLTGQTLWLCISLLSHRKSVSVDYIWWKRST